MGIPWVCTDLIPADSLLGIRSSVEETKGCIRGGQFLLFLFLIPFFQ